MWDFFSYERPSKAEAEALADLGRERPLQSDRAGFMHTALCQVTTFPIPIACHSLGPLVHAQRFLLYEPDTHCMTQTNPPMWPATVTVVFKHWTKSLKDALQNQSSMKWVYCGAGFLWNDSQHIESWWKQGATMKDVPCLLKPFCALSC